ncbi:hypothetical protein [Gimesia chilikensis]|uniref:hypothetical protein n=1 Tax=Gimesia chilikensis TaxID=2605989 RepID=UPI001659ED99|nr:hypothetical protein [Gimesia chilikensis]
MDQIGITHLCMIQPEKFQTFELFEVSQSAAGHRRVVQEKIFQFCQPLKVDQPGIADFRPTQVELSQVLKLFQASKVAVSYRCSVKVNASNRFKGNESMVSQGVLDLF